MSFSLRESVGGLVNIGDYDASSFTSRKSLEEVASVV